MRAPDFWSRDDLLSRFMAGALSPIGWAYGASVAWKRDHAKPHRPRAKVICVGNLTAGGSGKTPVTITIARALVAKGLRPFILSRGYGGGTRGPKLVDLKSDRANEVGDEALLLAAAAPTIVARDRRAGAELADRCGAEIIVMDDGHQNFALAKDLSLVVVDAEAGFGNGRLLPAGPLRESIAQGLGRADAVILVGAGMPPEFAGNPIPQLRVSIAPVEDRSFAGKRVVAFAGIGRPEKFFATLRGLGADILASCSYPDHHPYSVAEIVRLRQIAAQAQGLLVTTEKDFVRLNEKGRQDIQFLRICAVFDEPLGLKNLLEALVGAHEKSVERQ